MLRLGLSRAVGAAAQLSCRLGLSNTLRQRLAAPPRAFQLSQTRRFAGAPPPPPPPLPAGKRNVVGSPITWTALIIMLATGGGLVYYFDTERSRVEEARKKAKSRSAGRAALGGPFELVDVNNKTVTDKDFLGQWVLLYFGFTFCPDICPEELEKIGEIVDRIGKDGKKLTPVFISVDPHRDTPEKVGRYLKDFHKDFVGLTGSFDQVKKACKAYRVYFSKPPDTEDEDYLVDHSIITYLVNPEGDFTAYYGQNTTAPQAADSILSFMAEYDREHKSKE